MADAVIANPAAADWWSFERAKERDATATATVQLLCVMQAARLLGGSLDD
jgi:hypothetical protein